MSGSDRTAKWTMKLKVLIVDDEPPARRKLVRLLSQDDRFEIVGEAQDGEAAIRKVEEDSPDLLFLDIQMPRMTGFDVLEVLGTNRPQIIFTTAFDEYAIQAFEVRALDYLLKPYEDERFSEALDRAVEAHRQGKSSVDQIETLLSDLRVRQPFLRRILIRTAGRIAFVDTRQIMWIEAEEKYVRLHLEGRSHLHRESLSNLESRLDPAIFVRVQRSHIVNMEFIAELEALYHGDYRIVLKNGSRLPLGRTYKDFFLQRFAEPPES